MPNNFSHEELLTHKFPILIVLGPWPFKRTWYLPVFSFSWLSENHFVRFSPISSRVLTILVALLLTKSSVLSSSYPVKLVAFKIKTMSNILNKREPNNETLWYTWLVHMTVTFPKNYKVNLLVLFVFCLSSNLQGMFNDAKSRPHACNLAINKSWLEQSKAFDRPVKNAAKDL